jgi:hypothetical protein
MNWAIQQILDAEVKAMIRDHWRPDTVVVNEELYREALCQPQAHGKRVLGLKLLLLPDAVDTPRAFLGNLR